MEAKKGERWRRETFLSLLPLPLPHRKAWYSGYFWTWIWFLGIRLKKSSLAFDKVNELEKSQWDWKKANSLFKRRFRGLRRRGILNSLISRIEDLNLPRRKLIFRSEDWDLEKQTLSANRSGTMCVNDLFQFNAVIVHTIADNRVFSLTWPTSMQEKAFA